MTLFFILGREPALSATEIFAVLTRRIGSAAAATLARARISREVCVLDVPEDTDPQTLMRELGGTIKVGRVVHRWDSRPDRATLVTVVRDLVNGATQAFPRILFGGSAYNAHPYGTSPKELRAFQKSLHAIGIETKRALGKERKVRFVTSREPTLSSVVVETNKLASEGIEVVFLLDGERLLLGHTVAVQPFKEMAARDYGRPDRDPKSGMLPTKLARMLVNVSGAAITATLLDPFCGSGTILSEAWLVGYRSLIGSDIDSTAIARTSDNLSWLDRATTKQVRLIDSGVKQLPKIIAPRSVDTVVTEPYLGPPLRGRETLEEIYDIEKQLQPLFHDALTTFRAILKPGGTVVMAFPLWTLPKRRGAEHAEFLHVSILNEIKNYGFSFRQPLPTPLITQALAPEFGAQGRTLLYGRPDQHVWREIALLEHRT